MNRKKVNLWPGFFICPYMALFLLFVLIPAVFGVYISLTDWDLYSEPVFVGFENFRKILFDTESIYHTQFFNGAEYHHICFVGSTALYCSTIAFSRYVICKTAAVQILSVVAIFTNAVCDFCCHDHLGISVKPVIWSAERMVRAGCQHYRNTAVGMGCDRTGYALVVCGQQYDHLCCGTECCTESR